MPPSEGEFNWDEIKKLRWRMVQTEIKHIENEVENRTYSECLQIALDRFKWSRDDILEP